MRKVTFWKDKYGQLWRSTWWEFSGKKQWLYKKERWQV